MTHTPWFSRHPLGPRACFLSLLVVLLSRDRATVEGFRGILAPIQPVFSLAAASGSDKLSLPPPKTQPTFVDFPGGTLEFSWHTSIADIPARLWDGCLPSPAKTNTTGRSPFLEHSWLRCLETTGCVSNDTGWTPQHLSIHIHTKSNNNIKKRSPRAKPKPTVIMDGCLPAYIKTHSMGEFIFDDCWADAAFRNGLDYYPKLLVGVPFTPVTGPRILWHSQVWDSMSPDTIEELNRAVAKFLKQSASARGWSSVHINFCTDEEGTALAGPLERRIRKNQEVNAASRKENAAASANYEFLEDAPQLEDAENSDEIRQQLESILLRQLKHNDTNTYLRRVSLQYQWNNRNPLRGGKPYKDFDDYLSCFKSKRRITIRRERTKARQDRKIRIEAITGPDILKVDGLVERMFEIYLSTVDKMFWGRQYLTLEFFQSICRTPFVNNMCFFCVRYDKEVETEAGTNGLELNNERRKLWKAEDVFAGTVNVVKDGVFYGRYWGCLPGHEAKNLHFETCYWSAIDYCIENRLQRMEPGAGGADYKWARGFDPQLAHSAHYICNPLLRRAVSQFLESETEYNIALKQHLTGKSAVAERET